MPNNTNRGKRPSRGAARGTRRVVSAALRREHGFVARSAPPDPPMYKSTPIVQFKQRIRFTQGDTTATGIKVSNLFTGGTIVTYKVRRILAWAIAKAETDDALNLEVWFTGVGETLRASDTAGANHHAAIAICPPMDDFFVIGDTSEPTISVRPTGSFDLWMDIELQARLSLPIIAYTPPAELVEEVKPQHHTFCPVNSTETHGFTPTETLE